MISRYCKNLQPLLEGRIGMTSRGMLPRKLKGATVFAFHFLSTGYLYFQNESWHLSYEVPYPSSHSSSLVTLFSFLFCFILPSLFGMSYHLFSFFFLLQGLIDHFLSSSLTTRRPDCVPIPRSHLKYVTIQKYKLYGDTGTQT